MMVRSDQHSMKEIEYALTRLSQNGVDTTGFIFNGYIQKKGAINLIMVITSQITKL